MTCLKTSICLGALLLTATPVLPQIHNQLANESAASLKAPEALFLDEIHFSGLRHIAPAAVAAQIRSHPGDRFEAVSLDSDVRALARLGWFESIRVQATPSTAPTTQLPENSNHVTVVICVREFPFLSKVEYSGSELLSQKQIEKMLEDKKIGLELGRPADPAALYRIALAIRAGLAELGHPESNVRILREESKNSTVKIRYEISDGSLLRVRRITFDGHPQVPAKLLRAQMRNIAPWKPFASWRGTNAYTREGFEQDRQRILTYYENHGFPEARLGNARVAQSDEPTRRWLPWPHRSIQTGLTVTIPVEAGSFYRFESIIATEALQQATRKRGQQPLIFPDSEHGGTFSQQKIDDLRRLCLARISTRNPGLDFRSVEVQRTFDTENHTARVAFDLSDTPPYLVQRIEFLGLHKFSDRYVRRRIPLREGQPVNERALEAGLARLARTGYFKPIRKEDIHVQMDDETQTASVTIRIKEIGQQRASLVGGNSQFGATLGIAYTVFDLLNREELLSAQLEGGPKSLQVMLGLAKEGVFGTRASLAFSVFNNVIRPRFASSAKGPFFTSHAEGITIPWTYPLTETDSLGVSFTLSRATSEYPLGAAPGLTGLPPLDIRSRISSRSLGVAWAHDTGSERALLANSASGGWLGGGENMVRSSAEFGRVFRDPFFAPSSSWAFRTTFSGAGSYRGDMPIYARLFSGDELVRGLRPGELGPYAVTARTTASGVTTYSAAPTGANLVSASSAEYRIPLPGGTEAAGFFDLGSGVLLPKWLGPTKPLLLGATNGVLHGSTGVELRWTVPGVKVPVRSYYALNVLRMNRFIALPDNSVFHAHNRFSAFGWGLGALF